MIKDPKLALSIWEGTPRSWRSTTSRAGSPPSSATSGHQRRGGNNLHRNVIYRDGKDKADQVLPFTTFDSENPEDLWKWMQA